MKKNDLVELTNDPTHLPGKVVGILKSIPPQARIRWAHGKEMDVNVDDLRPALHPDDYLEN